MYNSYCIFSNLYEITYKKRNGDIFTRIRKTIPATDENNETSMGWKVIGIKYEFQGNFYDFKEYNNITSKFREKRNKKRKIKSFIKNNYIFILLYIMIQLLIILKK